MSHTMMEDRNPSPTPLRPPSPAPPSPFSIPYKKKCSKKASTIFHLLAEGVHVEVAKQEIPSSIMAVRLQDSTRRSYKPATYDRTITVTPGF